jgi:hypothetical protein
MQNAINADPSCKPAYQKLWNSWVAHRSLKVTKKELDDFTEKYKKNICNKNI